MTDAGVVVWMTGLPSSGKSTFAQRARERLAREGVAVCVLDGDEIRSLLVPEPGYSPAERDAFYETLANLAALLADQGLVVLVAATAGRQSYRDRARRISPAFVEVFVNADPDECARRDSKSLYQSAARGIVKDVPGVDAPYEEPRAPDVVARGGLDAEAVDAMTQAIWRRTNRHESEKDPRWD